MFQKFLFHLSWMLAANYCFVGASFNENTIPQFMSDIFNVIADENGLTRDGAPDLGKNIHCFYARDSTYASNGSKTFVYRFDLSGSSKLNSIRRVELRVYKTQPKGKYEKIFYRTDVVLEGECFSVNTSVMISAVGYGWQAFDITSIGKRFLQKQQHDVKLRISIKSNNGRIPNFKLAHSPDMSTKTLLIVYSDGIEGNAVFDKIFAKENAKASKRVRRNSEEDKGCRLQNLKIKFGHHDELKDVIKPWPHTPVNIYRCGGSCILPMGKSSGAHETYHSTLQRLIMRHRLNINRHNIIWPSCAPKKTRDLNILMKMDGYVKKMTLSEAIVIECVCV